jgi:hypothetical protein
MSFTMPDLVIESILREGFIALKRNPDLIDDVFASLTRSYASKKYGEKELQRIKDMISKRDWGFVHSFGEVESNVPCVSIQLGNESEDRGLAHLEDFDESVTEDIVDPEELAELVRVSNIQPDSYDPISGTVYVPDSVNLTQVHVNLLYVDAAGTEHVILGGIDNTNGQKQFVVAKNSEVDISDEGEIKSSIDYKQYEVRGVHNDVQILLGIHTKDALMTKYIYILVKYFLLARKKALIERCFIASSYQGSDFTRNLKYEGDIVFTRFLTVSGKVQDTFRSDQEDIFDNVEVITKVPKDVATTEDLGLEDQTIQVGDTDQE